MEGLLFDVFGTCVDWRSSIIDAVSRALPGIDAPAFADAWRGQYGPSMDRVRSGSRGYVPLDLLHLENLETVCRDFGRFPDAPEDLARAWERLDPWPDTCAGLERMRSAHLIAPCSNGSIALMTRLSRHAGMRWDCILGAELARTYKPDPQVYLSSCAALGLLPSQVTFVAAHNGDLEAARACGMRTAFVIRPFEHGPEQVTDLEPSGPWDHVAQDMIELAGALAPAR